MKGFLWVLSRMAAALSGTLVIGLIVALVSTVIDAATCGPTCTHMTFHANGSPKCLAYESTCSDFFGKLLWSAIVVSIFAVVLGILPGIAALTITPARKRPWRSLLILVPATLLGVTGWFLLLLLPRESGNLGATVMYITLFLFPTLTGLVAAWNIEKLPLFKNNSSSATL